MQPSADLEALEREAYRASWSDGIVDLFVGLSLVWVGTAWIWITDLSALAGIIPAVLLAPVLSARKRFVEARSGYVQWRSSRRNWERRNLWLILGAGILMLALGALLAAASSSAIPLELAPGIMAWLLALLVAAGAVLIDAVRLLLYAALLAASGVAVVLLDAMPGWPMLIAGIVATAVGLVLLRRFVRRYPAHPS